MSLKFKNAQTLFWSENKLILKDEKQTNNFIKVKWTLDEKYFFNWNITILNFHAHTYIQSLNFTWKHNKSYPDPW